ncbi:hypothetical protein MPSEU_000564300 [Mayamaea pseudoterrestris]|nr:hypothetical protein MPSEU_000564300 [Mayamaea pseudoterrestris]
MIGKKVRVFWPVDGTWYTGTVDRFDENSGEHLLIYPDGDSEWVKIGETGPGSAPGDGASPGHRAMDHGSSPDKSEHKPMAEMPSGPYGAYPLPGYPGYYGGPPGMPPPYGLFPPGYMYPAGDKGSDYGDTSDKGRKSGPKAWTKEEDALLLSIVKKMRMPMKWSIVALSLPGRTGKQCRERYVNHLNPRLKVTDWNALEDAMIFHLYNSMGSHWAKMSKVIPGRTDNGIKNRFHNLRRQFEREDEHRLRLSSTNDFKEAIRVDRMRSFPDALEGRAAKLWDMHSGIGILAAQSVLGGNMGRGRNRFGPFRKGTEGDMCVRCGFFVPSLQTGDEVCETSGWCQTCTRIPAHVTSNLLRECINLRREQDAIMRSLIESWEEQLECEDTTESKPENAMKLDA